MSGFAGIRPIVHVPFDGAGEIDLEAIVALVERMIGFGVDGLVVNGLASESWSLTEAERDAICSAAVAAAAGRVPVTAGVDGDTTTALQRGERALELGAVSLMVRPPAGCDGAGLARHYREVALRLGADILVQDTLPDRRGNLEVEQVLQLSTGPGLGWVKVDAPAAGPKIAELTTAGVKVVAGWGGMHYLDAHDAGALGCLPGADLAPALVQIQRRLDSGDRAGASELYQAILPLLSFQAESLTRLITGAKLALTRSGVFRSPQLRAADETLPSADYEVFHELFEQLACEGVTGW
jgi:4-hydroxy-tetrahydrodipicolinate synthase